jgi:hypothetical protein
MPKDAAEKHIRATIDTQHLGMWWKNFESRQGETEEQKRERFNQWYTEEFKKMAYSGIIGHIHMVDGMGGGHHHLPAGQGVFPIKTAMQYLKEKGYTGAISSEGYEEQGARILTKAWEYMGAPIYGQFAGPVRPGAPERWTDVFHSYFGRVSPPNYIFAPYAPSNDWTLWSNTPME